MKSKVRNRSQEDGAFFDDFTRSSFANAKLRVFLCGAEIKRPTAGDASAADHEENLRMYLLKRIEQDVESCYVFLGEHDHMISAYEKGMPTSSEFSIDRARTNLGAFEVLLAKYVDLVVIFPDSAGSLAELGIFAMAQLKSKLLVIIRKEYEPHQSFINRGPVVMIRKTHGRVRYMNYDDREAIYQAIRDELSDLHEAKALHTGLMVN